MILLQVECDDITIVRNFKKLLKNDWTNAVVCGIVSNIGVIIPAPFKRKKFYDTTIPHAMRRRVETTCHYEGPLTPIDLLKKEVEPFELNSS